MVPNKGLQARLEVTREAHEPPTPLRGGPFPLRFAQGDKARPPFGPLLLTLLFVLLALPAQAAERTTSDIVLVDQGTVVTDDLYAAGNRVLVLGRVEGDLVATAFEDVTIAGTVTGDVIALAGSVVVTETGSIGESLRAVTPNLRVEGTVEGDVLTAAWSVALGGTVGDGALVWAGNVATTGTLTGDLEGRMRRLDLGGAVDGSVDVTVNGLTAADGASVSGDLGYRSAEPFAATQVVEVDGAVIHRTPLTPNVRIRALWVMAKLVIGLLAGVCGLLVMWAIPGPTDRAISRVGEAWWRAWLRGAAVCLAPLALFLVAVVLLAVAPAPAAAAIPLLALFIPGVLAAVGVVTALALASPAAVYPWVGRLRNGERPAVRAYLYTTVAVAFLSLIPWLALPLAVFLIPTGIGGWLGQSRPA